MSTLPPIDDTHDPALRSWVDSANDPACDFPIQNLPFGRFRRFPLEPWRIGVAIGDKVLPLVDSGLVQRDDMAELMRVTPVVRRELRRALSQSLAAGSPCRDDFEPLLLPMAEVELGLPCEIGDYTDFYTGIHHATTVGKLFRPDNPLLPNYKWVPIGYHGRASSIVPSGTAFRRPVGQTKAPDAEAPTVGPSKRLDYELELGILVGTPNALGDPVGIGEAEDHLFGVALFNDWSARDVQAWEYQPLGPFLAKNFASTLSPWVVTMDALAPFRVPFARAAEDPQPLPYLDSPRNREGGGIDVALEVWLQTKAMRDAGVAAHRLSQSNFRDSYWTVAQLLTHHTMNGCNLRTGDLFGSGTQSGPQAGQGGSLLELSAGGKQPVVLPNGEKRTFLEDGDTLTLRAHCERSRFRRIGFGECAGTVLPAPQTR